MTCVDWGSTCPTGTSVCSPTNPGCIAPGERGPLDGWCIDGMECYDGNQKYCQAWDYNPPYYYLSVLGFSPMPTSPKCPAGMTRCSPNDKSCIESGKYGPDNGWCMDSMECFINGQKFCQPWNESGNTQCPTGSKLCSPNDTGCIEPNQSGPVTGWCKNGQSCYNAAYTEQYCQPFNNSTDTSYYMPTIWEPSKCPATHPKQCNPQDQYCIEIGETGPDTGWCASGGQQCRTANNETLCIGWNESCPSGTKFCRADDKSCTEPGAKGSLNNWCAGNSVQCYNNDGAGIFCQPLSGGQNDPNAWQNTKCPAGTGRCRADDKFCLEAGESGPSGSWCATGWPQYNKDKTVSCVSDYTPPDKPDEEVCIQVISPAYDPATLKCKEFATPCKVPKDWKLLKENQICQDGKIIKIEDVDNKDLFKLYEKHQQSLEDLNNQVKLLDDDDANVKKLLGLVAEGFKKLDTIKQLLKNNNNKEAKEALQQFGNDTLPTLNDQFAKIRPYIEYKHEKKETEKLMQDWNRELSNEDQTSEYFTQLSDQLKTLAALIKQAENAKTAAELQLTLDLLRSTKDKTFKLVENQHNNTKDTFLLEIIKDYEENAAKMTTCLADKKITDKKVTTALEKFAEQLTTLKELYSSDKDEHELWNLVEKMDKKLHKLQTWLELYGCRDIGLETNIFDEILVQVEKAVAERVEAMFDNLLVILNQKLQEAAVKIASLIETGLDNFSKKFKENAPRAVENIAIMPEEQQKEVAETKNEILGTVQDIDVAIDVAIDESKLNTFTAKRLRETTEVIATINWCGDLADNIQAKLNSAGLALESDRLDADDVNELAQEVNDAAQANIKECYQTGASPFLIPTEAWYFGPLVYNYQKGYLTGYKDAAGRSTGEAGEANPTLRAEALAMAMRLFDVPTDTPVKSDPWYKPYIAGAEAKGLTYNWDWTAPITRLETAELFTAIGEIPQSTDVVEAKKYPDYVKFAGNLAVETLTRDGIFKGAGETGNFDPNKQLLRSEFATVLERIDQTYK